jgi:hypothetical protein
LRAVNTVNKLKVEGSRMNTTYMVVLNEQQYLEKITSSEKVPARQFKRAQILLKSDAQANWSYEHSSCPHMAEIELSALV